MKNFFYNKELDSTNNFLWKMNGEFELPEGFLVYTDFQRSGKGQVGNVWESEKRKNILCSILLFPTHIPVDEQFLMSQIVSLGIKQALDKYTADITVKWPNDIYWKEKKIAGILIENSLQGYIIKSMVIGIGLNVNQKHFLSTAPNPVSLAQIIGKGISRKHLLTEIYTGIVSIYKQLDVDKIRLEYSTALFRKDNFYQYEDIHGRFYAKIIQVHPDGQLELETDEGERKGYYFKEVKFVL